MEPPILIATTAHIRYCTFESCYYGDWRILSYSKEHQFEIFMLTLYLKNKKLPHVSHLKQKLNWGT
ncbi:unnamed protein product, partial [Vitis vinifera]|uniref:Uncharacterized protein n=1 Tax=Vitis vinifera TaxID=29760 RepID=E0CQG9_VITVI